MSLLFWIIVASLVGGGLSVLAASLFLIVPERFRQYALPHLISFATGALLGAAFLALLPDAILNRNGADVHVITLTVLVGILLFFLLEKMVLWRHCHSAHCEAHLPEPESAHTPQHTGQHAGTLILIGDALHNFVDGVIIAAAFLVDMHLGIVTALAVAAHEIPQEIADFAVLLESGFTRKRAFFYNILSSLSTVVGAVLAYFSLVQVQQVLPYVLALAAASFIYIAVADLIPGLHKRTHIKATIQQIALISAGVIIIYTAHTQFH